MIRFGTKHGAAVLAILLWAAVGAIAPAIAGAPSMPQPSTGAGFKGSLSGGSAGPALTPKESRFFKRFSLSLDGAGDSGSLQLNTSVLIKPPISDHFFVAISAGAPLAKNERTASAQSDDMFRSLPGSPDFSRRIRGWGRDTAVDWMVIADWQRYEQIAEDDPLMRVLGMAPVGGPNKGRYNAAMIFLPADQWTMRAILSLGPDALEDKLPLSSRIAVAIDVDYQIFKSTTLGFDYGRTSNPAPAQKASSRNTSEAGGLFQGQVIGARLKIRF